MSLLAGSAVAIVLFATVGAVGGWLLAKSEQGGDGPPLAQATSTPGASTTDAAKPTRQPTKPDNKQTTPANGQILLPDLVGRNFQDARAELRAHRLGWRLRFGGAGQNENVSGTEPRAGTPVRPGDTVQIFVIGEAPRVVVPNVVGLSCQHAAAQLVDAGLEPQYENGRAGTVTKQKPEPAEEKRWNDKVRIHCGQDDDESDDESPQPPTN